jgi:hypothetical protein
MRNSGGGVSIMDGGYGRFEACEIAHNLLSQLQVYVHVLLFCVHGLVCVCVCVCVCGLRQIRCG